MAEYMILKRESCGLCLGTRFIATGGAHGIGGECPSCKSNGYIETKVNIIEVLEKVRWTEVGPQLTHSGIEYGVNNLRFNGVRIDDE
jgi:hypothetical protein